MKADGEATWGQFQEQVGTIKLTEGPSTGGESRTTPSGREIPQRLMVPSLYQSAHRRRTFFGLEARSSKLAPKPTTARLTSWFLVLQNRPPCLLCFVT